MFIPQLHHENAKEGRQEAKETHEESDDGEDKIVLVSVDNVKTRVSHKILGMCKFLFDMLEDTGDAKEEIKLPLQGRWIREIKNYCKHYKYDKKEDLPVPLPSRDLTKCEDMEDFDR